MSGNTLYRIIHIKSDWNALLHSSHALSTGSFFAENLVFLLWEGLNLNSQVSIFLALNLPSAKLNRLYLKLYLVVKDGKSVDTNVRNIFSGSGGQFE